MLLAWVGSSCVTFRARVSAGEYRKCQLTMDAANFNQLQGRIDWSWSLARWNDSVSNRVRTRRQWRIECIGYGNWKAKHNRRHPIPSFSSGAWKWMKRSNGAAHTAKNETDAINSGRWLLRYKTLNGRNQISKWNVFIAECIISDVQQIIRIVRIVRIVQIVQIVQLKQGKRRKVKQKASARRNCTFSLRIRKVKM